MSTTTQQSSPSNSLALVNSFYGPGSTLSWYLTCLSCLISWTLHPKKRSADAITGTFLTQVTFPTVASAHLITQIRSWPPDSSVNEQTLAQLRASLAASLTITETYLSLCIILLLPGLFARTPKRLSFLAMTGVFCLFSETYLYFALPSIRYASGNFERFFLIDSLPLLVLILVLSSVLVGLLLAYIYILFSEIRSEPVAETTSPADDADTVDDHGLQNKPTKSTGLDRLVMPLMLFSLVGAGSPPILDLVSLLKTYKTSKTSWAREFSFANEFLPRTEANLMDLGQAVALFGGMSGLGFSLYSVADAHYQQWWRRKRKEVSRTQDDWSVGVNGEQNLEGITQQFN